MDHTDLNAHAPPWSGPRVTAASSAAGAPGSHAVSRAVQDDSSNFVLYGNVTNPHMASDQHRRATLKPTATPYLPPTGSTPAPRQRQPLWHGASLYQRDGWSRSFHASVSASKQQSVPASQSAAKRPELSNARDPALPSAKGTDAQQLLPPPLFARASSARPNFVSPASSSHEIKTASAVSAGEVIFDGRKHLEQKRGHVTPATPGRSGVRAADDGRSVSAGSHNSNSDEHAADAHFPPSPPLRASESLFFDPHAVVNRPAQRREHPPLSHSTGQHYTPPISGGDWTKIQTPLPLSSSLTTRPLTADRDDDHVAHDVIQGLEALLR